MKILLIDDHALFRDGILLILEGLPMPVETFEASSYETARDILQENTDVDMILLDLDLPGISFIEALQAIRQLSPDASVVILSGTLDRHIVEETIRLGARGYIPKSAPAKTMLNALQLVISGDTYIPAEALHSKNMDTVHSAKVTVDKKSIQHKLTPRQFQVLEELARGKANKEIGRALFLTESTIRAHVAAILRSFDVSNRTQAVRHAVIHGWISDEDAS